MHVMVTGGAGYVGCRLVPALLANGYRVTVLDNLVFGDAGLDACREDIELFVADIRQVESGDLRGVDAIVHLAGLSNDPTAEYRPEANRAINLEATVRLGRLAKERGVSRFIFASSCSVYHTAEPSNEICDETREINPTAPYSWAKSQAEAGLLSLADRRFCPVVLRKGTVFGSSPRMRYDLVVNTFTCDAFEKGRLTIHCGGRMWRPLLHIEDAVGAYCRVLGAEDALVCGRVFNVLNGNHRILRVAQDMRRFVQHSLGARVELDIREIGLSRSYRVSADRIREELGFTATHDLDDAVADMWSALKAGIDPRAPIYHNIRWLETLVEMKAHLARMRGGPL